jgi:hypothetical protein
METRGFGQVFRETAPYRNLWAAPFWFGVMLVLAGILVLVYPAILVAIVAAVIMSAGVGLMGLGWRMRKLERHDSGVTRVDVHPL